MMKTDIRLIFGDHFATLKSAKTDRFSKIDLVLFYAVPILIAAGAYFKGVSLSDDTPVAVISFFGIFTALLLNFQVSVYSIFNRVIELPKEEIDREFVLKKLELRKQLIREVNANVSYHIMVSIFACFFAISNAALFDVGMIVSACYVFVMSHFALGLLLIMKRAYILFREEYQ